MFGRAERAENQSKSRLGGEKKGPSRGSLLINIRSAVIKKKGQQGKGKARKLFFLGRQDYPQVNLPPGMFSLHLRKGDCRPRKKLLKQNDDGRAPIFTDYSPLIIAKNVGQLRGTLCIGA